MAYIEGHARDQGLLLPASVEDYVAADSPVRFIDAFVDDLDLGEAGFQRFRPKATRRANMTADWVTDPVSRSRRNWGVPALTADREWKGVKVRNLKIEDMR